MEEMSAWNSKIIYLFIYLNLFLITEIQNIKMT